MLQTLIEELSGELDLSPMPRVEKRAAMVAINDAVSVEVRDLDPGVSFTAPIGAAPQRRREDWFIYVMRANLLGQGTGGARIGMLPDEKTLTLSWGFPYELNYRNFRLHLEDFVNYLVYWREEADKFASEEGLF